MFLAQSVFKLYSENWERTSSINRIARVRTALNNEETLPKKTPEQSAFPVLGALSTEGQTKSSHFLLKILKRNKMAAKAVVEEDSGNEGLLAYSDEQ